jgi:putative signal transducing protein
MYCPTCGEKYPWHVRVCETCGVELVEHRPGPAPDPDMELVPVYRTGDAAVTAVAASLLQNEGIEYLVRGEGLQDLFGYGRIAGGFNYVVGPAEFVVRSTDADRARELLKLLDEPGPATVPSPDE